MLETALIILVVAVVFTMQAVKVVPQGAPAKKAGK